MRNFGSNSEKVENLDAPTENSTLPESVRSLLDTIGYQNMNRQLSTCEENITAYIAGYICRKLKGRICENCSIAIKGKFNASNPIHTFISQKNYDDIKGAGLIYPSDEMYEIVKQLEIEYRAIIQNVYHMNRVHYRIVNMLEKKLGQRGKCTVQKCDVQCIIIALFVTIRLHHTLKMFNRDLMYNQKSRNRKLMKFQHV